MIKVISLQSTCYASPSQWEGHLDSGKMIYMRYRWGHLTITVSKSPTTNVMDAISGIEVFSKQLGDNFDGYITIETVKEHTKNLIEYPK